jgi:hypothetical protein
VTAPGLSAAEREIGRMLHFEEFTLARLEKHTEPRGACIAWTGSSNGANPQIRLGGAAGAVYMVRRVVYTLVHGEGSIPPGFLVGLRRGCQCDLCVHPMHLVARSQSHAQKGRPASTARKVRIAAAKRAKSRLTIEAVRAIRASDEPASALDARHGLTKGYASRIRRGEAWVDHASPFAGLKQGGGRGR